MALAVLCISLCLRCVEHYHAAHWVHPPVNVHEHVAGLSSMLCTVLSCCLSVTSPVHSEPPSCAECFCYEGHPEWEARLCSKHGFPSPGAEFCRESNGTLRQLYDQCGDVTLIESPPEMLTSGKRCEGDTEITGKKISASISSTTERVIVASVGYTTRLSVSPSSSPAGAERLQDVDSDTAMGPTHSGVAATPSRHSMTHFLLIIFVIHGAIILL